MVLLGCIADDFTGASDAASFLVKGGMRTILWNGIPSGDLVVEESIQAIVIALKTRTQKTSEAVEESMKALQWLKKAGAQQFYIKYCSTFDSTPEGNIGPIVDRAMDWLDIPYTVLCPSLPINGRTVEDGVLYVNGIPVHESHMKDHPLTPIWDSAIDQLMKPQSKYSCLKVSRDSMKTHASKEMGALFLKDHKRIYLIPDYVDENDGHMIVSKFGDLKLLTGGSGLLEALAMRLTKEAPHQTMPGSPAPGNTLLLAGSCSKATLEQIAWYQKQNGISYKIDPIKLYQGMETLEDIWKFIKDHGDVPVLVYSSDTSENVKEVQQIGRAMIAELLEGTMAILAKRAVEYGYKKIIVAGGETSGAVTKMLGYQSYEVGQCVAPGVPVMFPLNQPDIRLVLKSGNFGQTQFFTDSIKLLSLG